MSRIIGTLGAAKNGLTSERYPGKRLHVRAIVRDGKRAFVGSQSLQARARETPKWASSLTMRRWCGIQQVFEQDWALTPAAKKEAEEKKEGEQDKAKDESGDAKATQVSSPG
jgi:hypothetical protein